MANKYELLNLLGRGSFGEVHKAKRKKDNLIVACKIIDIRDGDTYLNLIIKEIKFMRQLKDHKNIIKILDAFFQENQKKVWIVMEYINRGSGKDIIDAMKHIEYKISEKLIAIICREILQGLAYVHKSNKIHRDIKSDNILFTSDGGVKLADFGVAAQLTEDKKKRLTLTGTPYWIAPEILAKNPKGYTTKADIWSFGITVIEFALGYPPLSHLHPMKALIEIPKAPLPDLSGLSKNLKDFIKKCLKKNPNDRATAEELLKHKFIKKAKNISKLKKFVNFVLGNESFRLPPSTSDSMDTFDFKTINESDSEEDLEKPSTVIIHTSTSSSSVDLDKISFADYPSLTIDAITGSIKHISKEKNVGSIRKIGPIISRKNQKDLHKLEILVTKLGSEIMSEIMDRTISTLEERIP